MSENGKSVLIAGLGRFSSSPNIDVVLERVKVGIKEANDAGYKITWLLLNPNDPEGSLKTVREALESTDFDAVIIGNGLRATMENTVLFEDMLNCAIEIKGGRMKLLFVVAADGILEALGRL